MREGDWNKILIVQDENALSMSHAFYAFPSLEIGSTYKSEGFQSHFAHLLSAKLLTLGYHESLPKNQPLGHRKDTVNCFLSKDSTYKDPTRKYKIHGVREPLDTTTAAQLERVYAHAPEHTD